MNPFLTTTDTGLSVLAAKHFRRQAKRLSKQLEGIRGAEDIECIHRARVASRRLRAGLRMFQESMDPGVYARWRKCIRRITTGLGGARDADVQIEFLCRVLCELNEAALFPGLARLLARLEKERERLQPKVVKAVDKVEQSGVLKEMQGALGSVRVENRSAKDILNSLAVLGEAERRIHAQLDELLAHESGLDDPCASGEHHAMRIAVKRLRYTLEIVHTPYHGILEGMLKTTKKVQTLLGDLHDCDVWIQRLTAFSEWLRLRAIDRFGHEGSMARLTVGIHYLRDARSHDRENLFAELVDFWGRLTQAGTWEELRRLASSPDAPRNASTRLEDSADIASDEHSQSTAKNDLAREAQLAVCTQNGED